MDWLTNLLDGDLAVATIGALVAMAAGLIGIWAQSRRDHQRWLRERRFETCREVMRLTFVRELLRLQTEEGVATSKIDPTLLLDEDLASMRERISQIEDIAGAMIGTLTVLGPDSLADAAKDLVLADSDSDDADELTERFTKLARKTMKVK